VGKKGEGKTSKVEAASNQPIPFSGVVRGRDVENSTVLRLVRKMEEKKKAEQALENRKKKILEMSPTLRIAERGGVRRERGDQQRSKKD